VPSNVPAPTSRSAKRSPITRPLRTLAVALSLCGAFVAMSAVTASGTTVNNYAGLNDLVCPSAGNCVGVGTNSASQQGGASVAIVASESGGTWSQASDVALPSGADTDTAAQNAYLQTVVCTSAGNCVAVGGYTDASDNGQAMAVSETNGSWGQAIEIASPAGAGANPDGDLYELACTSAGNCVTLGGYQDSSSNGQAMVAVETSGSWATRASEIVLPATANITADSQSAYFNSLACPTTVGNCVAVGDYSASNSALGEQVMVAEQSTGWTTTKITPPAGAATTTQDASLSSMACDTTGHCVAGGSYVDTSPNTQAMVATGTPGGAWTASEVTGRPAGSTDIGFGSLACWTTGTYCAAGGTYTDNSAVQQSLAAAGGTTTGAGSTWTTAKLIQPSGFAAGDYAPLQSLACTSATSCAGVGNYSDSAGDNLVMAATDTSGTWGAASEIGLPGNAMAASGSQYAYLSSLVCTATGACVAGGSYTDTSGNEQAMAATETGGVWGQATEITLPPVATTPTPTPTPAPTPAAPPSGVPAGTFGTPTTGTTVAGTPLTLVASSGLGISGSVTVPAGVLPAGTVVSVYPVVDKAPLAGKVPKGQSYVMSFAVTWRAPDGTSPAATAPITMTITDPSIRAGETVYALTATGLADVGSAKKNGTAIITFTTDPAFVVATLTARFLVLKNHHGVTIIGYDGGAKMGTRVKIQLISHKDPRHASVKVGATHRFSWSTGKLTHGTVTVRFKVGKKLVKTTTIKVG